MLLLGFRKSQFLILRFPFFLVISRIIQNVAGSDQRRVMPSSA